MNELEKLRKEIDAVDQTLVSLLEKRFKLVRQVGLYKHQHQLPILDKTREKHVLEAKKKLVDEKMWPHYERIFQLLMDISKELEV